MDDAVKPTRATMQAEIALLQVESAFVSDPDRRSIEYWYDKKLVRYYNLDDVLRYAKVHRWNDKRVAFWKGVQSAWLKQKQLQYMEELAHELNETRDIRSHVHSLIKPRVTPDGLEIFQVQPKSLEGMIRAYAVLDDQVSQKRREIMDMMEPMITQAERRDTEDQQRFSGSEMRKMAHQLMAGRRRNRRVELGIDDDEDYEDDDTTDDGRSSESGDSATGKPIAEGVRKRG